MTNTADIARKLCTQDRIDLLRILTDPHRVVPSSTLLQGKLVNVTDGQPSLSELGVQVVRHLDAGHRVQVRGKLVKIFEQVLATQTADDVEIEQAFRQHFAVGDLELFAEKLDQVCVAMRRAAEYAEPA